MTGGPFYPDRIPLATGTIVLGRTAVDGEDGILRGVPASEVQRRRRS